MMIAAHAVESTSYCLRGRMADGTYTRARSVAQNGLPFGTKIRTKTRGPGGLRYWFVRDRIGHGSQLDFWQPACAQSRAWGRRRISYTVVRRG